LELFIQKIKKKKVKRKASYFENNLSGREKSLNQNSRSSA